MTTSEENQTDLAAPYGYMIDPETKQLRPKKQAGRKRTVPVTDETDPAAHREARLTRQRASKADFYERHPNYKQDYDAAWREKNPDRQSAYMKKYNLKLKRQVMDAYGGHCACCGEIELVFLTIDHVEDNGAEHRREIAAAKGNSWGQAGSPTYRWLRDNGFPAGFQVLCANCNCGKQWNGGICPHQVTAEALLNPQAGGPLTT
jgi:hypothetical protein